MRFRERGTYYPRDPARERRGFLSPPVNASPRVRVRSNAGGVAPLPFYSAALEVVRGGVYLVSDQGVPIPEKQVVVCRWCLLGCHCAMPSGLPPGATISVVDAGPEHGQYILPWSTVSNPTISKDVCRDSGGCATTYGACCVGCVNNNQLAAD